MKTRRNTADNGRAVRTRGCVQGSTFPPVFRPRRKRSRAQVRVIEPSQSTRFSADFSVVLTRTLTVKNTMTAPSITNGTCTRNATLHPASPSIQPPKRPPRPHPTLKIKFPMPCSTPRFLRGTRSPATNMEMVTMAPPPRPATARPVMRTHSFGAMPQSKVPRPKTKLQRRRPSRRPNMSVRRPLRG